MKFLSEKKALDRLGKLKSDFRSEITEKYEHRAKSCATCTVKGSCCLDAHFVNVHISRLESVAINRGLEQLPDGLKDKVFRRVDEAIEKYGLSETGDTNAQKFACPLFEAGTGCLVHNIGKPVPCITHACYESAADLPPDELQSEQERSIDDLNAHTYGRRGSWLPLPLALRKW